MMAILFHKPQARNTDTNTNTTGMEVEMVERILTTEPVAGSLALLSVDFNTGADPKLIPTTCPRPMSANPETLIAHHITHHSSQSHNPTGVWVQTSQLELNLTVLTHRNENKRWVAQCLTHGKLCNCGHSQVVAVKDATFEDCLSQVYWMVDNGWLYMGTDPQYPFMQDDLVDMYLQRACPHAKKLRRSSKVQPNFNPQSTQQ